MDTGYLRCFDLGDYFVGSLLLVIVTWLVVGLFDGWFCVGLCCLYLVGVCLLVVGFVTDCFVCYWLCLLMDWFGFCGLYLCLL